MFDKFTETARRTLFFSRYESSRVGKSLIGTEHVLLGLLRENDAVVSELWRQVGLQPNEVRGKFPTVVEHVSSSAELPVSENAKRLLAYACHEAELRQDTEVEPFHLVLAMLRIPTCRAAILLSEYGLDHKVASEILRLVVPEVRNRIQIDERSPIILRESHYALLDRLAQAVGLSETPRANRELLTLVIMDALLATGIEDRPFGTLENFIKQLRAKLAAHSPGA